MNIRPNTIWTPSQWYNSKTYQVSYKRNYKAASSTVVQLLGDCTQTTKPEFKKRFSLVREPVERAKSIYKQMRVMNKAKDISFSEYLEDILKNGFYDKHQFPQSFWINDGGIMYLFKLDKIEHLLKWIGANKENLPHLNKRDLEIKPTKTDLIIINLLYAEDIELYNSLP